MSEENSVQTKQTLANCCRSARDGFGAAVVSHAGCVIGPPVAGMLGASLSHSFMAAAMYVTSPIIAVGATLGLDHLRGQKASLPKLASSAAIALAVTFGINSFIGHDHSHGDNDDGHHHHYHQDQKTIDWYLENTDMCTSSPTPDSL